MTLQYATGTATGQIDFLDELEAFITANGQNATVARELTAGGISGFANDQELSLLFSTPGVYAHFQSRVDTATPPLIAFEASTGLGGVGNEPYNAHTGGYAAAARAADLKSQAISCPITGETFTYYLFHDDGWLWIVLEFDGGYYQHGFVGQLEVLGDHAYGFCAVGMLLGDSTTASHAYDSTTLSSNHFVPSHPTCQMGGTKGIGAILDNSGAWVPIHGANAAGDTDFKTWAVRSFDCAANNTRYNFGLYGLAMPPQHYHESNFVYGFVQVLVLEPHTSLAGSEGNHAPAGYLPGAWACSNETIGEGEEILIDTDTYVVFPARTRRLEHREQYQAIAFLKP